MVADESQPLQPGISARVERVVSDDMTAAAVGSGLVAGLSTPMMIALMEGASVAAVAERLTPGQSTVGTRVDVAHLAPTPVGMRVVVEAVLQEVDRRRLLFAVSAWDDVGEVGRGIHERFVVDLDSFEERLRNRGKPQT